MLPIFRNSRGLVLWLLAALTEAAVATPWVVLLFSLSGYKRWPEMLPPIWFLWLAFLGAALWEAGARAPKGEGNQRRLWTLPFGMAVLYLLYRQILPADLRPAGLFDVNLLFLIAPSLAYLWYQGARSGTEGLEYIIIYHRFRWQVGLMMAGVFAMLLTGVGRNPQVQVLVYWNVPLLFIAGLTLLVATRERALRDDQAKQGDSGEGGTGLSPWLTGVVLALTALTLGASHVLSVARLSAVTGWVGGLIGAVYDWLVDVAMLIVTRWVQIIYFILEPYLRWRQRVNQQQKPPEQTQNPENMTELMQELAGQQVRNLDYLIPYVKGGLLVLLLALLGFWLYRMNRAARRRESDLEEERVSLGFWSNLRADLAGLIAGHGADLASAGVGGGPAAALDPHDPRMLFRRLQTWGESVGRRRSPAETPNAYQGALAEVRPDAESAVSAITAVYNQARYGAKPPTSEAVNEAASAAGHLEDESK